MNKNTGGYQQNVITALAAMIEAPTQAAFCELVDYAVDLAGLIPGQVLTREVKTVTGTLLLSKGFMVTNAVIAKLKNYQNIYGIALPLYVNAMMPTK
jgi:hypothetical protein